MKEKTMKTFRSLIAAMLLFACLCGIGATGALAESVSGAEIIDGEEKPKQTTALTKVDAGFADDKWSLILTVPALFHQLTFRDEDTGLYVHYKIYLPEKYDPEGNYPLVLFLADETSTGTNPDLPLTQGLGGLVWAAPAWQEQYPAIVAVPLYREKILDHELYTTTNYVRLTKNYVNYLCEEYAVDRTRIYGTGQGMGCETLMVLAAKNPDLFTACMFVSGSWDAARLRGLEKQKFILFSAERDRAVQKSANELMDQLNEDGVGYAHTVWDGNWTPEERSRAGITLTTSSTGHYFVSWKRGTVRADTETEKRAEKLNTENAAIHLASYDKAYTCVAVMEWLFSLQKETDQQNKQ